MLLLECEPAGHEENGIGTLPNDRRDELRLIASERWQIRLLDSDLPLEICSTNNVSRCGLYFVTSSARYAPGMKLFVIRNFDLSRCLAAEEMGEVLRVDPLMDGRQGVAIRIRTDE
jgi:hypothetical protein